MYLSSFPPQKRILGSKQVLAVALLALFPVASCTTAPGFDADLGAGVLAMSTDQSEDERLRAIADQHAKDLLRASPEFATQLGVAEDTAGEGFSARLSAYDRDTNREVVRMIDGFLSDLQGIDRKSLTPSGQITYDVMLRSYALAQRHNAFGSGLPSVLGANPPYAVIQLFGPQIDLPRLLIAQHPLNSVQDAEDWVSRLDQLDDTIDDLAALAEADANRGVYPPSFALSKAAIGARETIAAAPEDNQIIEAFIQRTSEVEDPDEKLGDLSVEALRLIRYEVYPAYQRFADRMDALAERAPPGAGVWRLPDGGKVYELALDAWGAGDLTPDDIHNIGLTDIKRIHREMDAILSSVGYVDGSVGERMALLAEDPRYLIDDTDEAKAALIECLQVEVDRVLDLAPRWFGTIPDFPIEVRRIPLSEEAFASGGYYTPPSLDGSRPGIFWVNLKSASEVPTYTLKSLAFHEAVPGHHFQAAIALSITDLPLIQKMMWFGDYGEGWALYAEELAKEMGLYEGDPLGDLGRLRMELYRSARLVVDTGLHHKRWSREQAIDYMVDVTGESRESIVREIERYAVWPGQAASYKLGMIQFQRLRADAEARLGERFDIKAFHDLVLKGGAMPMAVLSERVEAWIEEQEG